MAEPAAPSNLQLYCSIAKTKRCQSGHNRLNTPIAFQSANYFCLHNNVVLRSKELLSLVLQCLLHN